MCMGYCTLELALRASITVGRKQTESYVEERREEKKEKQTGVSQTASSSERFGLCSWASTTVPAGLLPAAVAKRAHHRASQPAGRRYY